MKINNARYISQVSLILSYQDQFSEDDLHDNNNSLSSNNMTNNHHPSSHSDDNHDSTSPEHLVSSFNDKNTTSATIDHRGGRLENKYWGVSLDIPEGAIPEGVQQHIYFVITDPRTTNNAPPLDLENGIVPTLFSTKLILKFTLGTNDIKNFVIA